MSKVACPYCYHRVDGNRLWFQCAGRGSPGRKGCGLVTDEERARETGFTEAARPVFAPPARGLLTARRAVCPQCGGESGVRACPCCHTPLSANFGASASPLIAMVGAKGTGKTVYLTVLAHELQHRLRRRFDADVRLASSSRMTGHAAQVSQVFGDHGLFEQTEQAPNGWREPMVFEWRQERLLAGAVRRFRTTYLSFYDTAGEDLTSQHTTHDLTYLGAADALILLLDPFMIEAARDQIRIPKSAIKSTESTVDVVNRVTEKLRASHGTRPTRNIKIPVAVAFAKIDAFFDWLGPDHSLLHNPPQDVPAYDETTGRNTHEAVLALLHRWGADGIDAHLQKNYDNFRYFAVSALGAPPDYDEMRVDPGGVRPFRVDEPLLWLLSRFGVVPAVREQR